MNVAIQRKFREFLRFFLPFDEWHLTPIEYREYAKLAVRKINYLISKHSISEGYIVEIGCGLGDIISSIDYNRQLKMGLDISPMEVRAAKILHPQVIFRQGSFDDIINKNVAILVAIDFLHRMNGEKVTNNMQQFVNNNKVDRIVVDRVQSPPYTFSHDFDSIFKSLGYKREYSSRGVMAAYDSRRHLLFYKRVDV